MNNSCTEKTHNKSVLIVYPIRGRIKPDAFRPYRRAAAVPSGNASCKKLPRDSISRLISRIRRGRNGNRGSSSVARNGTVATHERGAPESLSKVKS